MPTYRYECLSCGYQFDKFQNMNENPVKTCPQCGHEVKRLIGGGIGFILKGSGFYATDYKNKSNKKTCCGRNERCDKPPCSDESGRRQE